MTKFILLNAPRLVGKDVAITHLKSIGYPLQVLECKDHLHKLTMSLFNVPEEQYWGIYNDRSVKEVPLECFKIKEEEYFKLLEYLDPDYTKKYNTLESVVCPDYWLSIRQAMIYVSELVCKPAFGEAYFGMVRAENVQQGLYIDGSCGFPEELPPLISKVGQENILLVRIHRDGFTFEGDSRGYISDGVIDNTVDLDNNGSEFQYLTNIEKIVRRFLK